MATHPVILDWTRKRPCKGCREVREVFACDDGLRCGRCRPKGWTPPDALAWLARFRHLVNVGRVARFTHNHPGEP